MPVAIRNLTSRPIFVPLNSGTNLRLSAGAVSDYVHEVEVKDNSKVDKLQRLRAIAVEPQAEGAAADRSADLPGIESDAGPRARKKG
jgi:hypothetical protein